MRPVDGSAAKVRGGQGVDKKGDVGRTDASAEVSAEVGTTDLHPTGYQKGQGDKQVDLTPSEGGLPPSTRSGSVWGEVVDNSTGKGVASELKAARDLKSIGSALERFAAFAKAGNGGTDEVMAALSARFAQGGVEGQRSGVVGNTGRELMVFAGRAGIEQAKEVATQLGTKVTDSTFQIFSAGDPFTVLKESPAGKDVVVVQGEAVADGQKYDLPTLVTEALQQASAAITHGASSVTLVLPERLDPLVYDDPFARLVSDLCAATGVDKIQYSKELNRTDGPKAKRVDAPQVFLDRLALELTRTKTPGGMLAKLQTAERFHQELVERGRGPEAKAFAKQLVATLAAAVKVQDPNTPNGALVPGDGKTVVYAGGANPELGAQIADSLGAVKGAHSFKGDVPQLRILGNVEGQNVVVVQSTRQSPTVPEESRRSASAMFVEALMLGQAAHEQGAASVRLVLPYMTNARGDKSEEGPGNYVGGYAKLVATWANQVGFNDVTLVTPHDVHTPQHFTGTKVKVVDGLSLLTEEALKTFGTDKLVLATPDDGATKRTHQIAERLGIELIKGQKHRTAHDDKATVDGVGDGSVSLKGKVAIIPDDEVGTGGTLKQAAKAVIDQGADVIVAVAHNNMVQDSAKRAEYFYALRDMGVKGVYFLDTQPMGPLPKDLDGFVRVISVADAIASKMEEGSAKS